MKMTNQQIRITNQFRNLTEEELRTAFLAASQPPRINGNNFFNSFKYKYDLFAGNYSAALSQGIDLLNKCRAIDEDAFIRIHKGTAYYWLGAAAYLAKQVELATYFMDAAVSEDMIGNADPINAPTPAMKYILLDGVAPEQAARPLVEAAQAKVQDSINVYNNRDGHRATFRPLSLDDLRTQFIIPAISPGGEQWRSLMTTLISFRLEWDHNNELFDTCPPQGTFEPFFLHLFKGCVLFESLLKNNPNNPITLPPENSNLGAVLQFLHNDLNIRHDISIGKIDFPTIVTNLVTADESIQTAIEFAGQIRNTVGHNLGWVISLSKIDYQRLFQLVMSSCLHAIVCLY